MHVACAIRAHCMLRVLLEHNVCCVWWFISWKDVDRVLRSSTEFLESLWNLKFCPVSNGLAQLKHYSLLGLASPSPALICSGLTISLRNFIIITYFNKSIKMKEFLKETEIMLVQ